MKNSIKIFESYFISKKNKLYYNEIKEISSLSDSSLSRILKYFVEMKLLKIEKTKSNTYYLIHDYKYFILEYCKISYIKFKNLNLNVKIPLKNFIKQLDSNIYTVVLFGSTSRGEETINSDIDLLIVKFNDNIDLGEIKKKINLTSIYPISLFECSIEEFKIFDDHVIVQAIKTGFPIFGEQNFYEELLNENK